MIVVRSFSSLDDDTIHCCFPKLGCCASIFCRVTSTDGALPVRVLSSLFCALKRLQDIEKLKKSGGARSFNVFLLREIETMQKLLEEIKSSLQVLYSIFKYTSNVFRLLLL
jgi:Dynein heavy chain C-terminal domain